MSSPHDPTVPDRWPTCASACSCAGWIGRGDKNAADRAAVDPMRRMINTVTMQGVVVIGEGEKDEAPMLFNGEPVGDGDGPEVDVAVEHVRLGLVAIRIGAGARVVDRIEHVK